MRKVVIIHLSDIHYSGSDESNILFDKLNTDIELMKKEITKYDLLTISGDCIDRGNVNLFDSFGKKLNVILKTAEINNKSKSIIVPGNHDVTHDNVWLNSLDIREDNVEVSNQKIENDLSPFFKEYNDFIKKYGLPDNGIGIKYFKCNDVTIRVIFINSVWSTLTKNKYGELIIGDNQLNILKKKVEERKQKSDITLACMHHPFDWFRYEDRIKLQEFLFKTAGIDFLLHGHIHEASYDVITNMDSVTNIFCTGISYQKVGENSSRKDGMRYSIYEIDLDTRTVNVYLRSTNKNMDFVGDNRLYTKVNKEGFFSIPIGNVTDCLLPVKTADNRKRNSIFTNHEFVELLLKKEELLYRFYCGMEATLDELLQRKPIFTEEWKKNNKKHNLSRSDKLACEKAFYKEQFELYCMFILTNFNALFFEKHNDVRLLLRKYDSSANQHTVFLAEGAKSTKEDLKKVRNFTWGEGMITTSYKYKSALLKSQNMAFHKDGNSHGVWKEYLTIAVSEIEVKRARELIPLFALNIATESLENEKCLQALAMSSIYDKIQDVFKLFQVKATNLAELYDLR